MATWTVSGLVPVNIPIALDAISLSSVQENWFITDEPFASELSVGDTIVAINGSVTITADAGNTESIEVFFLHGSGGQASPSFVELGTVEPGMTESFDISIDADHQIEADSDIFAIYANQQGGFTGTELTIDALTLSFDMTDEVAVEPTPETRADNTEAVIQVRYSDDGGRNWSNWRNLPAGKTGAFLQTVVTRRLGMSRQRTWEFMDTSNRPQDVLAASLIAE